MTEPGRNENEAIARRAYEIWEAEGRPHGRDREHWEAAARELGSPVPPRPRRTPALGASPSGKAAVFGTAIPRFESWRPSHFHSKA